MIKKSIIIAILSGAMLLSLCQSVTSSEINSTPIHAGRWDQVYHGVILKVELITKSSPNVQHKILMISVKNTTTHALYLDSLGGEIQIYYLQTDGDEMPLYDYGKEKFMNRPFEFEPNKVFVRDWRLSNEKLEILEAHPFRVSFTFFDPIEKKRYTLTSSQILL